MSEPKRMSMEELRTTREYARLTERQKMFIETYCSAGLVDGKYDAVVATLLAYKCKDAEVARIMSYSLMANIRIVAVLDRHFGETPVESFLKTLERAIHNKKLTIAQLQALRLKCDIMGFASGIPRGNFGTHDLTNRPSAAQPGASKPKKPKKTASKTPPPAVGDPYGLSEYENKDF